MRLEDRQSGQQYAFNFIGVPTTPMHFTHVSDGRHTRNIRRPSGSTVAGSTPVALDRTLGFFVLVPVGEHSESALPAVPSRVGDS